jgi:hypothetical protein
VSLNYEKIEDQRQCPAIGIEVELPIGSEHADDMIIPWKKMVSRKAAKAPFESCSAA